jgi:phosphinothricin acetyltransferase
MTADATDVRVAPMGPEHAEPVLAIYQLGIDEGNATFETAAPTWEVVEPLLLPGCFVRRADIRCDGT